MNILAIDPGNVESGYCFIDSISCKPTVFDKIENKELENGIVLDSRIDYIVIERIASYGMAVGREVFETCEEIGRITMLADIRGIPHDYVYRRDEKLTICGSPKATDANIRRALIDRFAKHDLKNGKGTKDDPDWFYGFKADVWSAYAVGVTWLMNEKGEKASG